jgi:hypothetical protein
MRRSLVWLKDAGAELAEVELTAGRLAAAGTAIGADPLPYRLDYELLTGDDYATVSLLVSTAGDGWRRRLELRRDGDGTWKAAAEAEGDLGHDLPAPGGDAGPLAGAVDCDLGLCPLTNTMPVLRHGLLRGGGPVDLAMAWVSVPDLAVFPSPQRYTHLARDGGTALVRFESEDFRADIAFDDDGLVLDYPGIARRAVPAEG